jgi:hypothetical protein
VKFQSALMRKSGFTFFANVVSGACRCQLLGKKYQDDVVIQVTCILIWPQSMNVLGVLKAGKAPLPRSPF